MSKVIFKYYFKAGICNLKKKLARSMGIKLESHLHAIESTKSFTLFKIIKKKS